MQLATNPSTSFTVSWSGSAVVLKLERILYISLWPPHLVHFLYCVLHRARPPRLHVRRFSSLGLWVLPALDWQHACNTWITPGDGRCRCLKRSGEAPRRLDNHSSTTCALALLPQAGSAGTSTVLPLAQRRYSSLKLRRLLLAHRLLFPCRRLQRHFLNLYLSTNGSHSRPLKPNTRTIRPSRCQAPANRRPLRCSWPPAVFDRPT